MNGPCSNAPRGLKLTQTGHSTSATLDRLSRLGDHVALARTGASPWMSEVGCGGLSAHVFLHDQDPQPTSPAKATAIRSPSFVKPFAAPAYPPCTSEQGLLYYASRYFAELLALCTPGDLADGALICSKIFLLSNSFVQFGQLRRCSLKEVSRVKSSNNLINVASFGLHVSVCRGRKRGGCARQQCWWY
jgi:hypothetical protein